MKITPESDSDPSDQYKLTWKLNVSTNHDLFREIIHARTR